VQLLPDSEELGAAARAVQRWLRRGGSGEPAGDALHRRMVMAAAMGEERNWLAYENRPVKIGRTMPPHFCSFDPADAAAGGREEGRVDAAIAATPMAPEAAGGVAAEERDGLYADAEVVRAALQAAVEAGKFFVVAEGAANTAAAAEAEAEEVAEEAERLRSLEVQVWVEFDALLRRVAAASETPSQVRGGGGNEKNSSGPPSQKK